MAPSINSTHLLQAVNLIKNSLSIKTADNFTVSCRDQKVYLEGFSLQSLCKPEMSVGIPFTGSGEDWEVAVSSKPFIEAVKCFPKDSPVSLVVESKEDKTFLNMVGLSSRTQVQACEAGSFMGLDLKNPLSREINTEEFIEGVQSTFFAASNDHAKQALTAIHLNFSGESMEMTGCDGHRLSEITFECSAGGDQGGVAILAKPLKEIASLIKKHKSTFPVNILFREEGGAQVICKVGGLTISYVQGIMAKYPNTKQLFPDKFLRYFVVDQKVLLKELELVEKVVKDYNNTVLFTVSDCNLRIESHNPDKGGSFYGNDIPCYTPEVYPDFRIGFNVRYLIEVMKLSALQKGKLKLEMNGATNPAVMTLEGCDSFRYLVMPVQVRS